MQLMLLLRLQKLLMLLLLLQQLAEQIRVQQEDERQGVRRIRGQQEDNKTPSLIHSQFEMLANMCEAPLAGNDAAAAAEAALQQNGQQVPKTSTTPSPVSQEA